MKMKTDWSQPLQFDWVMIPAGWFWMGSDPARDDYAIERELPYHRVYLPTFHIARTPVTVSQFASFVRATGYKTLTERRGESETWRLPRGPVLDRGKDKSSHPVTRVLWPDALAFCDWARVRLPTEAEWEKAARGTDGRIYPWGNAPTTLDFCNLGAGDTTPVGSYPVDRSPYGVLDMSGNVRELTSSLRMPYPYDPTDGRERPTGMQDENGRALYDGVWTYRVERGGCWGGSGYNLQVYECNSRCALRLDNHFSHRASDFHGFRVAALEPVSAGH